MGHSKDTRFTAPLKRAKGLGSSNEGVHHWLTERVSAVVLIPFTLWLVFSIVNLKGAPYDVFTAWIGNPCNAVMMIIFMIVSMYHGAAGLQVVIEDYITCHAKKLILIWGIKVSFAILAVASVFSILKIAL